MNQKVVVLLKAVGVFFITIIILWFLLILSALIPNERFKEHMTDSVYYFSDKDAFQNGESGRLNEITDNYADSISLNLAWNMGRGNPLVSSLDTCYYDGEEYGLSGGLYYTVMENVSPNTDYTRYWHGTGMVIRGLSLITDIEGIRFGLFVLFLMLAGLTVVILVKAGHTDIAIILLISLAAVQCWNLRLCLEYLPMFVAAFALVPIYLIYEKKCDTSLIYLSVLGGVVTAFFDFLTTETITILIPLIVVWAVRIKEGRNKTFIEDGWMCCKAMTAWAVAYGGTFLVKWMLAAVVTGKNVFALALDSVSERVGSQVPAEQQEMNSVLDPLFANVTAFFGGDVRVDYMRLIVGLTVTTLVLASVWYLFRKEGKKNTGALLILFLGLPVPVRYMVLSNHSYLHCFFTHRAMVVVVLAVLMAIWLDLELPQYGIRKSK